MKSNKRFQRSSLALAVAAAGILSAANTTAYGEDHSMLEEVIVTASGREQRSQDIPYNISSMNGDSIRDQNIIDQADLLRAMSGVSVVDRGYRNSGTVNSIVIRGLNVDTGATGDIVLNAAPTVSTYVDNTPLFANFVIKDIQRVEVLRGPQGTLYGSGALGGTVRYISNKPSTEGFDVSVEANLGYTDGSDGNNSNIDAMFNIPLTDNMALRANIGRIDNDGIIDYINAYQTNEFGEPLIAVADNCVSPREASNEQVLNNGACYSEQKDADTVEIDYAKIALSFAPSDELSFLFSYQTQEDETGARRSTTLGDNGQASDAELFFDYGEYDSGQVLLEPSTREVDLYSMDVEWDMGFATLSSSSSVYDHEGVADSDNGGLWVSGGRDWIDLFGYAGWPRPAQRAERGYEDKAFIQEFRLVSNETVNNIDWLLGAFYMDQDQFVYQNSYNPGMDAFAQACAATDSVSCASFFPYISQPGVTLTERDFEYTRDQSFEELAIYGELTYHYGDSLHVTVGARWFENETVNDTVLGFPLYEGDVSPTAPQSSDKDSDILLKANISWDVTDRSMLYGTVSEGYRRGGAQAVPSLANGDPFGEPNADAIRTYEKDTVINYEIGYKGSTDNFAYTLSAFYVDWQDPQLNTTTSFYGFYVAANGDSARTAGIELELDGYLNDSLHYRMGYTYVTAELTDDFISPQTGGVIAKDGSTLPGTPENVLTLAVDNTWAVASDMSLVGRINAYYQSDSENFINKTSQLAQTHDAFWLVGASLTLQAEKWDLTLYGKNLGNEEGSTGSFPSSYFSFDTGTFENWYGNGNRQFISQPQTLGLSARYKF